MVAVILLSFSIVYGIGAQHLPKAHLEEVIEANVYPFVLAVLLAGLSLLLLLRSLRANERSIGSWLPPRDIVCQIVFLFAALTAYVVLFQTLGYLASTVLFMVGTLKFIDRRRSLINVILFSVLISGISYALFVILLQIPVPRGFLM